MLGSLVLILAALAAIILLFTRCQKSEPHGPLPGDVTLPDKAASSQYISEMLFIGDSRTAGLVTYGFLPQIQALAMDGLNHKTAREDALISRGGRLVTIPQAAGEIAPKRMLVSFGINGLGFMGEEDFLLEYEGLLDDLLSECPDSTLIIQSIYPVSAELAVRKPELSNQTIAHYNELLKALAQKKGGYFLNTCEVLSDSGGALLKQYDAGDGLHLNTAAYEVILQYVSEHPAP